MSRVYRVLVYEGPDDWVNLTLKKGLPNEQTTKFGSDTGSHAYVDGEPAQERPDHLVLTVS